MFRVNPHINTIFKLFKEKNPNPTTELHYNSNFELLISVILSAQATDVSVNKATSTLFSMANTPKAVLKLGEANLKTQIKNIGLYNTKASNIIKACQILIKEHNGEVPNTRQALEALPGVGRKTANVVLNTAFKQPTIAVDTHIFRVSNRIGLAEGKTVEAVERQLIINVPKKYQLDAHHWLILHGRYICKARSPLCKTCFIQSYCQKNLDR